MVLFIIVGLVLLALSLLFVAPLFIILFETVGLVSDVFNSELFVIALSLLTIIVLYSFLQKRVGLPRLWGGR